MLSAGIQSIRIFFGAPLHSHGHSTVRVMVGVVKGRQKDDAGGVDFPFLKKFADKDSTLASTKDSSAVACC